LPFPATRSRSEEPSHPARRWPDSLHDFAWFALAGAEPDRGAVISVPAHARRFLDALSQAQPDERTAWRLVEELREFEDAPAGLERPKRLRQLVYTWVLAWTWGAILVVAALPNEGWRGLNVVSIPVLPFAVLAIIGAFAVSGGPAMWLAGMTLHDRRGQPAGRLRSGWRAILAWSPLLAQALPALIPAIATHLPGVNAPANWAYALGMVIGNAWYRSSNAPGVVAFTGVLLLLIFAAGVVAAVRRPDRGWQDRLAGTHIVPR
jgi:hypothetical protein